MSDAVRPGIARRPLLAGLLATAGVAVVGLGLVEFPQLFAPRYAPTPFDDLLALLPDRAAAARLGATYLSHQRTFDLAATAQTLRRRLANKSLPATLASDLGRARIVEAHGWVLPETIVLLCAVAAKAG